MPVPLFFADYGVGSPLIILHGLFGSSVNWRRIARFLGQQHRVLAIDLRNHGQSAQAQTMSYAEMVDDLFALMDREALLRATLLGHSVGGKVAMLAALRQPERVAELIIVDIAPVQYRRDYTQIITALQGVDLNRVARRADADVQLKQWIADMRLRSFLLQNLVSEAGRYRWRVFLPGLARALPELHGFPDLSPRCRYWGKSLVVRGEQSDYVVPEFYPVIRARFPLAEIVSIPGASHWVHADQPERFQSALQHFLAQ
ncbi:MAG: alpha/beta fold hydrolase [Gammaproteobacteria bacterium]|jgi:pimeloyl-ACP methyl ester carboxylesterase